MGHLPLLAGRKCGSPEGVTVIRLKERCAHVLATVMYPPVMLYRRDQQILFQLSESCLWLDNAPARSSD